MLRGGVVFACLIVSISTKTQPNILFMLADDMGWRDLGMHGGELSTPNLDSLFLHGVIMHRHYSQPVCTASRSALLTSRFPSSIGMSGTPPIIAGQLAALPLDLPTMPQFLRKLGYSTHLAGKWHLGYPSEDYLPTQRGFDSFFGFLNGYIGHYDGTHIRIYKNVSTPGLDWWRNEKRAWSESTGRYSSDVIADEVVKIMGQRSTKPKFVLASFSAPHAGNPGPTHFLSGPKKVSEYRRSRISDPSRKIYSDMVCSLDAAVGRVIVSLERNGVLNNTIVIFVSDNGSPTLDYNFYNRGSNWPLRGQKYSNFEGGIRTIGAIWSNQLQKTGHIFNGMFHLVDWLPTLYQAAGGNIKDLKGLDGMSQWNELVSGQVLGPRQTLLTNMDEAGYALIHNRWKIVKGYASTHTYAFADSYCGASGRGGLPYNLTEVQVSSTSRVLSKYSTAVNALALRRSLSLDLLCLGRITTVISKESPPWPRSRQCNPCLFDVVTDPCEWRDQAVSKPDIVAKLTSLLNSYKRIYVKSNEVTIDFRAEPCRHQLYWAPWINTTTEPCNAF